MDSEADFHECGECLAIHSIGILYHQNAGKLESCRLSFRDKVLRGALLFRAQDKAIKLGKYWMPGLSSHEEFYAFECWRCNAISVGYVVTGGCPYFRCHNCNRKVYLDITIPEMLIEGYKYVRDIIRGKRPDTKNPN